MENEFKKYLEMKRHLEEMEEMEEANNRVKHPNNNYVKTIIMTPEEKVIEKQRTSDLSKNKQELENELQKLIDTIAIKQLEIELHLQEMEEVNRVKANLNKKMDRNAKWKSEAKAQNDTQKYYNALKQMKEIEKQLNSPAYRRAKQKAIYVLY